MESENEPKITVEVLVQHDGPNRHERRHFYTDTGKRLFVPDKYWRGMARNVPYRKEAGS